MYIYPALNPDILFTAFSTLLFLLLVILVYRTQKPRAPSEKPSNTDGLSGLMNHRKNLVMLDLQIELNNRHELALSVLMAERDHLKQQNDKYGPVIGDRVLSAFSPLCQYTFCHTDIVGVMGA